MTIAEKIARAKADYDEVFEAGKKSVLSVLDFSDIESTTYRVTVPSGADDFARVNKIGGMSYKTRNLLRFPYDETTITRNGITFTSNADGSVTLNGTNNGAGHSSFHFSKITNPIRLSAGTYIGSTGNSNVNMSGYDGTSYYSFSTETPKFASSVDLNIYIQVNKGNTTTFNNVVIYPMLNEGTTVLPYEPYFEGLRSASVSELKSEGANIVNILYTESDWLFNSGNGTVISVAENLIEGQGKAGASPYYPYASNGWLSPREASVKLSPFKKGDRISLSYDFEILELPSDYTNSTISVGCGFGFIQNSSLSLWKTSNINFSLGIQRVSATFDITDTEAGLTPVIRIAFSSLHAKVSNIMINYGDVTSYKPYKEGSIDTLPIHEAIKSLDGYGLGVNAEYYNYIDFERKVFVQNVYRKVFDGTERWIAGASSTSDKNRIILSKTVAWDNKFPIIVSSNNIAPVISNVYNTVKADDTWVNVNGICINNLGELIIYDEAYNTADISLWKAHVAELYANGNPLVIDYVLAEPIETDISAYLKDEYIEVEGGGTITAVNEYGLDAPTNISYLIDTQGG